MNNKEPYLPQEDKEVVAFQTFTNQRQWSFSGSQNNNGAKSDTNETNKRIKMIVIKLTNTILIDKY